MKVPEWYSLIFYLRKCIILELVSCTKVRDSGVGGGPQVLEHVGGGGPRGGQSVMWKLRHVAHGPTTVSPY